MLKVPRKIPQGSILVETIAATLILVLVMVASTPPIITAVVTRIQSRRVSQSIQLAQQEIDKVREIFATGYALGTTTLYTTADLPPAQAGTLRATLSTTIAPTAICTTACTATQGRIVKLQDQQFLVQTFRTPGLPFSAVVIGQSNQPIAFRMGVRVYSSTAIANLNAGGTLSNTQVGSSIGLRSDEKGQATAPLVVLYTDFVRGDLSSSQQAYQLFLTSY